MEKHVESQFSEDILHLAAEKFGLNTDSLKLIGQFENYVYEGMKNETKYILRLVHSTHRSKNMVLGELDWINYLSNNGIRVAKSLPSLFGSLVEVIEVQGDYFTASLFEIAPGKAVDYRVPDQWNEGLFEAWGKTIGKMHKATKNYGLRSVDTKRLSWDEDDLLDLELYIPKNKPNILNIGNELISYLKTLPKDNDSYGLIHTDIHSGNFFVHQGEITVFDFDDAAYQWFISDIAIALYYSVWWCGKDMTKEEQKQFAKTFMQSFLIGYNKENQLEDFWFKKMSHFLRLRDITLYSVLHKKWDIDNLNEGQINLLKVIEERITNQEPIVDVNHI